MNEIKNVPEDQAPMKNGMPYQIARSRDAGVFAGWVAESEGGRVVMLQARRLWYWDGANSLSQLAMEGVKRPQNCKFPVEVNKVEIFGVCELIDCTESARQSILGVEIWEQ